MGGQLAEGSERIGVQLGGQFAGTVPFDFAPVDQGEEQVGDHAAGERVELRWFPGAACPGAPLPGPVQFLGDAQQDGAPRGTGILEGAAGTRASRAAAMRRTAGR